MPKNETTKMHPKNKEDDVFPFLIWLACGVVFVGATISVSCK